MPKQTHNIIKDVMHENSLGLLRVLLGHIFDSVFFERRTLSRLRIMKITSINMNEMSWLRKDNWGEGCFFNQKISLYLTR